MSQSLASGLIAHWPFTADCQAHANAGLTVRNHGVQLNASGPRPGLGAAIFNGRSAFLEVEDHPSLKWGTRDFSVAAWVHTSAQSGDVIGDVISKFDSEARTGLHLGILTNTGVTSVLSPWFAP